MAQTKGNIRAADPEKGEAYAAPVETVTEKVPHEADASSAPGPYEGLEVNRPPVSTNDPEQPIADSLVAGAGAPTGPPEIHPETHVASNAYVTAADKENVEKVNAPEEKG
jgi:hypothetical protein